MILKVIGTGSSGNCYTLTTESGEILLLECGVQFKTILKCVNYSLDNICGCLVTHEHQDHQKAHKSILESCVTIYTHKELKSQIKANRMFVKEIKEKKVTPIGEFKVIPFYLPHSMYEKETGILVNCPNYGFLINHPEAGTILYATDFEYLPYSFQKQKINHMIIECNYIGELVDDDEEILAHRLKGHCSLSTCIGAIKANMTDNLKTITLIHLSETKCDPDIVLKKVKEIVPESVVVNVATKNLEINLERGN